MSLPASKKLKITAFSDLTSGVNINDPAMSLSEKQCSDVLNIMLKKRGFVRWPGCTELTAQDAVDDVIRGLFHHSIIAGTQYLYLLFGGEVFSVNKSTGALGSALYDLTGDGEGWGCSSHGTFFLANGTSVIKTESATAYQVGITAPTGVTATGATSGGSLPDGTYKLYASYARRVGGSDVLYSKGQSIADVVISGGGGSGKVTIASFANSADAQVGNKVIWMTGAGGSTYYLWSSTGDNTTTTWDITSATAESTSITYSAYAANNDLPGAFTFLFAFDNRLWGIIDNNLYYSQKGATVYDLEKWPANNVIVYPYKLTGMFACGGHLCLNTEQSGVIIQPKGNVGVEYEHYETRTSFKYLRTIADWGGNKIGVTKDRIGVFRGDTLKFEPYDYGYNIRPVLERVWSGSVLYEPCGIVYRRENRIEYQLSLIDTDVNETNANRTYVLNLSRTFFYDVDKYKTPWEIVGRGYDKVCVDADNTIFYGQSYSGSSTIYKELSTNSTEKGLYNDNGDYVDTATNMTAYFKSRTVTAGHMFAKFIIENIRAMFKVAHVSSILVTIEDDPGKLISQETDASAYGQTLWDEFLWDVGYWSAESIRQYEYKGDRGVFGYSWSFKFTQTADDIDMEVLEFSVLTTIETGRGI
jgi:hypothetical protein